MGATWISWRTTTTVIITMLQIEALISMETKTVNGVEGQSFEFRCKYPDDQKNKTKRFCNDDCNASSDHLIQTDKHNQWERKGRFSLYDRTTEATFIVKVDNLTLEDSGTYRCGVADHISAIRLDVSRAKSSENLARYITTSPSFGNNLKVDKLHLPLYLTAMMCVAAILCVCLFTVCLLLAVKHQSSGPRQKKETSSDYENMMPGIRPEPESCCCCSDPECTDFSALTPPPNDLCTLCTSKHRESTVGEYVDMDVTGLICQYQHLDLSRLDQHIYHSLHGNSGTKDGPLGVKEQTNSTYI